MRSSDKRQLKQQTVWNKPFSAPSSWPPCLCAHSKTKATRQKKHSTLPRPKQQQQKQHTHTHAHKQAETTHGLGRLGATPFPLLCSARLVRSLALCLLVNENLQCCQRKIVVTRNVTCLFGKYQRNCGANSFPFLLSCLPNTQTHTHTHSLSLSLSLSLRRTHTH